MSDIFSELAHLKRPTLLVQAAMSGVSNYQRKIHLRRLIGEVPKQENEAVVGQLLVEESDHNRLREQHHAEYSVSKHLEYLIAIMAELRGLHYISGRA